MPWGEEQREAWLRRLAPELLHGSAQAGGWCLQLCLGAGGRCGALSTDLSGVLSCRRLGELGCCEAEQRKPCLSHQALMKCLAWTTS